MKNNTEVKFSIFTPTFNRADLLPVLYKSLSAQTYTSFEWLIVDGGSDESEILVNKWKSEANFSIRYIRQITTGLHGAYNEGAQLAVGQLFLIMHSDDSCLPETLMCFNDAWNKIPQDKKGQYSGVWARCLDQAGNMIGESMGVDSLDSTYHDVIFGRGFKGELFPMVRTDVMKEYPFPMIKGARFIPEGVVWSAIGLKYRTIFIDIPLRKYASISESTGSTDKLTDPAILTKNAPSIILYYRTTLLRDIAWAKHAPLMFLRIAAAYSYYSLLGKITIRAQIAGLTTLGKILFFVSFPVGAIKYLKLKLISSD
jgi:glycosyltransferase involved in cell wall biosynthesis